MKRWWMGLLLALPLAVLAGCATGPSGARPAGGYLEIRLASDEPTAGYTRASLPKSADKIYVSPEVELTDQDIKSARVLKTPQGLGVGVEFTWGGAKRLRQFTVANIGRLMAIYTEHRLLAAYPIKSEIADGKMLIVSDFTPATAEALAKAINERVGK